MSSFQKGQKVVCLNSEPYAAGTRTNAFKLVVGSTYTIAEVIKWNHFGNRAPDMLTLEEDVGINKLWWRGDRFTEDLSFSLPTTSQSTQQPVETDNYTCTLCKNPKCSTSEKSCWKCGEPILQVVGNIIVGSVKVIYP